MARYHGAFADLPTLELPEEAASVRAAWHLCAVRLRGLDRRAFCAGLRRLGVGTQVHYIPVNTFPLYRDVWDTTRPHRWRRPSPRGWSAFRYSPACRTRMSNGSSPPCERSQPTSPEVGRQ